MDNTIHSPICLLQSIISGQHAKTIDFLRAENQILRKRITGRIMFTDAERRTLAKYGLRIKDCLEQVATLVKPETILAWNRQLKKRKWDYSKKRGRRRRKRDDVEEITVRLAMDNVWGYVRIQGELAKLGHAVSPSWIRIVLVKHGIPPSPRRNGISWKEFINSHLDCTWATDFFTEEIWTRVGLVICYVLFFIHLATRSVHIAGCTHNPNSLWVSQQARNFLVMQEETAGNACRYVIHDRDTTFHAMDNVLELSGLRIVKTACQTPHERVRGKVRERSAGDTGQDDNRRRETPIARSEEGRVPPQHPKASPGNTK